MAKTRRATDLAAVEGDPTARAYVELPQEDFEFQTWARGRGLLIKTRTAPRSPVNSAIATFLLAVAGCGCTGVLAAVSAPAWATISGLIMPAALHLGLRLLTRT